MASLSLLVIRTPNIETTKHFYEKLLRTTFVKEWHGEGPQHYAVMLRHRLVFEIYPGIKSSEALGFRMASVMNGLSAVAHLSTKEPKLFKEGDRLVRAVVYDPDGRRVELT